MNSIDALISALQSVGYEPDRRLATAVFLALKLQRPLLLEGEPGVGKTELAKALSQVLQRQLIRLQCYDGLELREALYEWNHTAQLLHMRAAQALAHLHQTIVRLLQPGQDAHQGGFARPVAPDQPHAFLFGQSKVHLVQQRPLAVGQLGPVQYDPTHGAIMSAAPFSLGKVKIFRKDSTKLKSVVRMEGFAAEIRG